MALQNILGDIALDASVQEVVTAVESIDTKTLAAGQAVMASSTPVVIASNQSAIPVSGTFYPATQPVSIAATVAISGALTDTELRAVAVPVSGTLTVNTGLTDAQIRATALPVSGTVAVTGVATAAKQDLLLTELQLKADLTETQPVSIASMPSTPVTGTFYQATQPVSGTFYQATQPVSIAEAIATNATLSAETTKVIGTVNPPAITKGTQGANGFMVQQLHDSGRNQTNYHMPIQIINTNTDALIALTAYKGGAAVAGTTTPAVVTTGKTYRITSITMDHTTVVTTPASTRFTLRANLSGVVAITSPVVAIWEVGEPSGIAPVAGKKNTVHLTFPEGMEFPAGTGLGISKLGISVTGTASATGYGRITIHGYEY